MANKEVAKVTETQSEGTVDMDAFLQSIKEQGVQVVDTTVYGGGELTEKDSLVGVPFVVTDFEISQSDSFTRADEHGVVRPVEFAVVRVITIDNERKVFTDGGTGILPVLAEHQARTGQTGGLLARQGLRASRYNKKLQDGSTTTATTYYFG